MQAAASVKDGKRILFRFDKAAFSFNFLPFKVPYPVPFKLLGDEAKGWLDTTYLSNSGNLRISKGNKVNMQLFGTSALFAVLKFPLTTVKHYSYRLLVFYLLRIKDPQICWYSAGHHICATKD